VRRKKKGMGRGVKGGALIALAAGGATAGYLLLRRDSGGDDRIDAPTSTAPVVEQSFRGHSDDPAQGAAPIRPASAAPADAGADFDHGPPAGAVMPDTSAGDPLVEAETAAAGAQAASIGGDPGTTAENDPAARPVAEGSGDSAEGLEATEAGSDREKPA
jgi:hypothetical protein